MLLFLLLRLVVVVAAASDLRYYYVELQFEGQSEWEKSSWKEDRTYRRNPSSLLDMQTPRLYTVNDRPYVM